MVKRILHRARARVWCVWHVDEKAVRVLVDRASGAGDCHAVCALSRLAGHWGLVRGFCLSLSSVDCTADIRHETVECCVFTCVRATHVRLAGLTPFVYMRTTRASRPVAPALIVLGAGA